jgi:hypothetical protein
MKKIQAGLGVAVVAVLSVASFAFAEGSAPKPLQVGVGASTQTDIGGDQNHEGSKVNSSTDVNTHMEAGDQNEQKDGSMNSSDTKNSDTGDMGERDEVKGDVSASYRSATAPFSQNLLRMHKVHQMSKHLTPSHMSKVAVVFEHFSLELTTRVFMF